MLISFEEDETGNLGLISNWTCKLEGRLLAFQMLEKFQNLGLG